MNHSYETKTEAENRECNHGWDDSVPHHADVVTQNAAFEEVVCREHQRQLRGNVISGRPHHRLRYRSGGFVCDFHGAACLTNAEF